MKQLSRMVVFSVIFVTSTVLLAYVLNRFDSKAYANNLLSAASDIITIVTSSVAFIIALALYKKFSGSQYIVDRQTENVLELIDHLSRLNIFVEHVTSKTTQAHHTGIYDTPKETIFRNRDGKEVERQYVHKDMLKTIDYLANFSHKIYTPKEIANKAEKYFYYPVWVEYDQDWHILHEKTGQPEEYLIVFDSTMQHKREPRWQPGDLHTVVRTDLRRLDAGMRWGKVSTVVDKINEVYADCLEWLRRNNLSVYETLNVKGKEVYLFSSIND